MLKDWRLDRSFFDRGVHDVAPELIGANLLASGAGGIIVEVEADDHEDPAAHGYRGRSQRNLSMFGHPGARLRVPFLRHPLVPELCLHPGGCRQRGADPRDRPWRYVFAGFRFVSRPFAARSTRTTRPRPAAPVQD